MSQSDREMVCCWRRAREGDTSERWFFCVISGQPTRHPLTEFFHPSNLFQMPNDHGKSGNFLCNCKRIGVNDPLIGHCKLPMTGHCAPLLQGSVSFANLLEPTLHCTFISSSWLMCCWCYELSLLLYDPFWTWISKLLEFAFCVTLGIVKVA